MSVEIPLMYRQNSKGPKTVPCHSGTPDKTGAPIIFYPIYNSLNNKEKKSIHFNVFPPIS